MAECATILSSTHLRLQKTWFKATVPITRTGHSRILERKLLYGNYKLVDQFPSHKAHMVGAFLSLALNGSCPLKESNLRCRCLGTLTNPESLAPLNWVPVIDQVLLSVSMVFVYMAGVVPYEKVLFNAQKNTVYQDTDVENSTFSGRSTKNEMQINVDDFWGDVKRKLVDALDAIEHDGNLENRVVECENYSSKSPLSLFAIVEGPRLRLLWVTLQRLRKEVINTSQAHEVVSRDVWLVLSFQIIQRTIQPIFIEWLEKELSLENKEQDKELIARTFEKLKEDDSVLKNFKGLGKADLYADLLFFLRFGSFSTGYCYEDKLLAQHGADILEDMVISLADGISSMYLELISVDSNMSGEMNGLGLTLCLLSTRELQRLRNEVVLKQWLHQNFESVVSMYEDRFDLCVLQRKILEGPSHIQTQELNWWKKLAFKKPASAPLHYVLISQVSIPVKRMKELRALTGWRYYFSLFLELSDITMPLVGVVYTKASNAVSFFLTYLIGRSLGLICTGIRQSLGWR